MSLPDDLLPGSFRGVRFLMEGGRTSASKKLIKKLFPNSTRQSLENLGLIPKTFNIVAILSGDDYLQSRDALVGALENDDFGTLIHPFYGTINRVIAASYEINERMSSLGDSAISIVFEQDTGEAIPEESGISLSTLSRSNTSVVEQVTTSFNDQFNVSGEFPNNFSEAVTKIDGLVTAFSDNTSFLSVAASQIDSFSLQLSELASNITSIVTNPTALSDSINSLFETANGLYTTPEITYEVLKRFFDFGDSDILVQNNTASRIERIKNAAVFNQFVQSQALSYCYLNVSQFQFEDLDDIEETSLELEQQYQKIISNSTVNLQDPDIGISSTAKDVITDLRVKLQDFFDTQTLTAQRKIQVFTNIIPARVLSYQYYQDSSIGERLAEINNKLGNPSFLQGQVEILVP